MCDDQEDGRPVTMWEIEVDLDDRTLCFLREKGLEWIREDQDALVSYAANRVLREQLDRLEAEERKAGPDVMCAKYVMVNPETGTIRFCNDEEEPDVDPEALILVSGGEVRVKDGIAHVKGRTKVPNGSGWQESEVLVADFVIIRNETD